jgi:hypothetical protein
MPDEHILRVTRATDVDGPEESWPCSWCAASERVVDGWVVDHEDVIPGQVLRAFVCHRCARTAAQRAAAPPARGRQICSRCGGTCPDREGVVLGRVDEVAPEQVLHVPLCRPCADAELAQLLPTPGTAVR